MVINKKNFKESLKRWLYRHPVFNPYHVFYPGIFRLITGPFRVLPDFLIIGAGKSGTTSLYNYLIQHPKIHPAKDKELNYFFRRWTIWYRPNFPTIFSKFIATKIRKKPFLTGEATPFYLVHPLIPNLVKNKIPKVKIIVLLRNPIDRAYAQFNHQCREKFETRSFEEAIKNEKIKTREEWAKLNEAGEGNLDHERFAYLQIGMYYNQLKAWEEYFPKDQFLIMKGEDFFANPSKTVDRVFEFLEVPPHQVNVSQKFNEGKYKEIGLETRKFLLEYFKPHNKKLYELLETDFQWD